MPWDRTQPNETSWKPGQSGNPAGRPPGAKTKYRSEAIAEAVEGWEEKNEKKWADEYLEMDKRNPAIARDIANRIYGPAPTDIGEKIRETPGRFVMVMGGRDKGQAELDDPDDDTPSLDGDVGEGQRILVGDTEA